jgi:hypothetical protein
MYRSVISNLIGSICSPHLQSVSVILVCLVGEVEHFPWGVVNSLTKASPHMLQKVEIALQLRVKTNHYWGITSPLSPREYESYFRQVRSALPDLDKKVIMSIAVRPPLGYLLISHAYDRLAHCRIFLMRTVCDTNDTSTGTHRPHHHCFPSRTLIPTKSQWDVYRRQPTPTPPPLTRPIGDYE